MILRDLFEADGSDKSNNETPDMTVAGYQDPAQDTFGSVHGTNTHTPKLSLKVINNMKKIMQAKNAESERRKELMAIMYAAPPSEEG
ncbi:MAG: hypothetical protein M0R77_19570 [Gammaproteobacteria bacterium]|nr:hypothetical protein [Gammaproteobacteria bacterium]